MREVQIKKILDLKDSLWGFSNLISKETRKQLRKLVKNISKDNFMQYSQGKKYALSSNSDKFDKELFKSDQLQKLIATFDDINLIEVIGKLLYESNTDIIHHLVYNKIITESNKFDLIENLGKNKYKLLPLSYFFKDKKNSQYLWRNKISVSAERLRELMLSNGCIPYIPSFEFSRIEKGGFIRPHTDISRKIASIMIYLPDNDEQRESKLGTIFWDQKKLSGNNVYSNGIKASNKQLFYEEYELFKKQFCSPVNTTFQDEYTLIFFRSNTSWHSVEYNQKNIGSRLSININFNFPEISK